VKVRVRVRVRDRIRVGVRVRIRFGVYCTDKGHIFTDRAKFFTHKGQLQMGITPFSHNTFRTDDRETTTGKRNTVA